MIKYENVFTLDVDLFIAISALKFYKKNDNTQNETEKFKLAYQLIQQKKIFQNRNAKWDWHKPAIKKQGGPVTKRWSPLLLNIF